MPWGEVDEDTVLSPGSFEAALYAAGGAMNAVSAVMEGRVQQCLCVVASTMPSCHQQSGARFLYL